MDRFIAFLAVVLTVLAIAWAADLFRYAGLLLYTEQFLSGILAIAVPLVLLSVRLARCAAHFYDISCDAENNYDYCAN